MTVRLACWSGPRNISTATMRAWENRPDTEVVDEPLYAWYLAHTGLDHPGRDEVIAAGETDWRRVVESLTGPWPDGPTLQYQKHMAQHLVPDLPREWITSMQNVLLIRDPAEVVSSYLRSRATVVPDDIGILQQLELHVLLGRSVPVIDSADEAFVTGTFAGVVPVHTVDGRTIGSGRRGPMVSRLQELYADLVRRDVARP